MIAVETPLHPWQSCSNECFFVCGVLFTNRIMVSAHSCVTHQYSQQEYVTCCCSAVKRVFAVMSRTNCGSRLCCSHTSQRLHVTRSARYGSNGLIGLLLTVRKDISYGYRHSFKVHR